MATILTKKSDTASSVPSAAQLTNSATGAELAVNTADKRLYTKDSGGNVVELGTNPTSLTTTGSVTSAGASNSGNLNFTGTGNRITGDFSNATVVNRVAFQGVSGTTTDVGSIPPTGATVASFIAFNSTDSSNSAFAQLRIDGGDARFASSKTGTGSYLPMAFHTGGSERVRIDTSGNVGIGTSSPSYRLQVSSNGGTDNAYMSATAGAGYVGVIGAKPFVFETNAAERARIDSSGNLLLGTTSAVDSERISVNQSANKAAIFAYVSAASSTATPAINLRKYDNNNTTAQTYVLFAYNQGTNGAGGIQGNGASGVQFFSSSDVRLKENITEIEPQLANILALKPSKFDYINGPKNCTGFIAQEVEQIYPDVIGESPDGFKTIGGISTMEARLIKAIQELNAKVEALTAEIQTLKGN